MLICSFFLRNACTRGEACSFSHQPHPGASTTPPSVQDTQAVTICLHFQRGACRYGNQCLFLHPGPEAHLVGNRWGTSQAVNPRSGDAIIDSSATSSKTTTTNTVSLKNEPCKFFAHGRCVKGNACQFSHADPSVPMNAGPSDSHRVVSIAVSDTGLSADKTIAQGEPCKFFDKGMCKKGNMCPFRHLPIETGPSRVPSNECGSSPGADQHTPPNQSPACEPCTFPATEDCTTGNSCAFYRDPAELSDCAESSDDGYPGPVGTDAPVASADASPTGRALDLGDGEVLEARAARTLTLSSATPAFEPCGFSTLGRCTKGESCYLHHVEAGVDGVVGLEVAAGSRAEPPGEVNGGQDDGGGAWIEADLDPSVQPVDMACKFFRQGQCTQGDHCQFQHENVAQTPATPSNYAPAADPASYWGNHHPLLPADLSIPLCKFFMEDRCAKGDVCGFRHFLAENEYPTEFQDSQMGPWTTEEGHGDFEAGGWGNSPGPPAFGICKFFQQGMCRKGEACSFRHDTFNGTESDGTALPPSGEGWSGWAEHSCTRSWTDRPPPPCKFFLAHGTCRKGASCTFRHDAGGAEESSVGLLSSEARTGHGRGGWWDCGEDDDQGRSSAHSQNTFASGSRICRYFSQGNCRQGDACTFRHDTVEQEEIDGWGSQATVMEGGWPEGGVDENRWDPTPVPTSGSRTCRYFAQGTCTSGDECLFRHDATANDEISSQSEPQDAPAEGGWVQENDDEGTWLVPWENPPPRPCMYYARGSCRNGDSCSYHHDKVENDGSADPVGSTTGPAEGSSLADDDEATWSVPWSNPDVEVTTPPRISAPCIFFGQGHCHKGDACRYLHVSPPDPISDTGTDNTSQDNEEHPQAATTTEDPSDLPADPVIVALHEPSFVDRSMFHCTVRFGAGATPQEITTAFESRHIILSNLSPNVTDAEIVEITETFGDLITVHLDISPTKVSARVEFAECAQAASAVQTLNNIEHQSMKLAARLDLRAAIESGAGTPLSRKVKISWYAPSLVAWAHYPTITKAKNEAIRLDGMTFDGRKIRATFQTPRRNQTHSFSVIISSLPPHADSIPLEQFCVEASSISMGRPNYGHSPVDDIRDLLERFGPLEALDILPTDRSKTKITAFAQFSCGEAADAASKTLNGVKQTFLGSSPLWIQQIFSVKYSIRTRQFEAVKGGLDQLRDAHDKDCKIRYYDHADPVCIRIYGQDPKTMGCAKVELERLLHGETLISDGKDVWDEYFDTPSSQKILQRINNDHTFFVKCDSRNRTIRLFGREADRERARGLILRLLKKVQSQRHILPLQKDVLYALLNGGLRTLHDEFGSAKVTLDVVSRALTVRGETDVVQRVRRAVISMASYSASASSQNVDVLCPVCYCEAADPIKLSCGHVYCTTCLQHFLRSAIGPNFIQLRCIAEELDEFTEQNSPCHAEIPYHIIRDVLPTTEEKVLLESSFLSYIHARPAEFHYCPTPDCRVVYRPGVQGTALQCPSCLARICAACHVEFHEGLSCAEHLDSLTGGHEALDRWRKENGVKPCPNCQADLEKNGGCNHIQCIRCKTHMCWVCMKTFPASGVYDHMNQVHGGIGIDIGNI